MQKFQLTVYLFIFTALCCVQCKSWDGYQVLRLKPTSDAQIQWIRSMRGDKTLDFWSPSDVMVGPNSINAFTRQLITKGIQWSILIADVQKTVAKERSSQLRHRSRGNTQTISFDRYCRYDEIKSYLSHLSSKYKDTVTVGSIGKSVKGRDIPYIIISPVQEARAKETPMIFVEGGIHAREWISPAMVLYIIHQLVENTTNKDLIENVGWIITPVLNPDGYEYSHTKERFWRKNRSPQHKCQGVDLNRNFDHHWMEAGASDDECSDIFAGPRPFSEAESLAFSKFVLEHRKNIHMYISFHSYGNFLVYPWCYTADNHPDNIRLKEVASRANKIQEVAGGSSYEVGPCSLVIYLASGSSMEWAMDAANVSSTYTVELPGGGKKGFDMPPSDILKTVSTFFPAVRVFAQDVADVFYTDVDSLAVNSCSANLNLIIGSLFITIQVIH